MEQKEEMIRELSAKLNQLTFGSIPERDQKIIELLKQGLSRRRIGKKVKMSPWGVSKALHRFGVNSG
jgi:DNA-binding NarL/FixJ family response regulator